MIVYDGTAGTERRPRSSARRGTNRRSSRRGQRETGLGNIGLGNIGLGNIGLGNIGLGIAGRIRFLSALCWTIVAFGVSSVGRELAAQDGDPAPETAPAPERLSAVEVTHVKFPEAIARELRTHGGWLPIYLELECRGDRAETVTVETKVTPRQELGQPVVSTAQFEVAPGAPRRAWVYVRAEPRGEAQEASLEVKSRGQIVRTGDRWTLNAFDHDTYSAPTIFVAGGQENDQRPWYRGLGSQQIQSDALQWFEHHELPDSALGYQAVDIVILRGLDEKRLEPAQVRALRDHVYLGGYVVFVPDRTLGNVSFEGVLARTLFGGTLATEVSGDPAFRPRNLFLLGGSGSRHERDARRRKPVRLDERILRAVEGTIAADLGEEEFEDLEGSTYVRTVPFDHDAKFTRSIWSYEKTYAESEDFLSAEGDLLYGEVTFGVGRVGALAVNDQDHPYHVSESFRTALWSYLVEPVVPPRGTRWRSGAAAFVAPNLVSRTLKDSRRDIGVPLIAAIVVVYLLIVGPGIYFFLRRRNRLPSILWVEPCVILLSLGGVFGAGYFTKGLLTKVRLKSVIHQRAGIPLAFRESYAAIFSADDIEYSIECPAADVVAPLFANAEEAQDVRLVNLPERGERPASTVVEGLRLAQWQQGYVVSAGVEELGEGVSIEPIGGDVEGEEGAEESIRYRIVNGLDAPIVEFALMARTARGLRRERRVRVTIGPGESYVFDPNQVEDPTPTADSGEDADADAEPDAAAVLRGLRERGIGPSFENVGSSVLFWALLDRSTEYFQIDQPSTLAHRHDFYVLYR